MNKLEIILKHIVLKKYLKSNISGKLFLTKNPNEIKNIGEIYKKLFDIEYNFDEKLLSNYIFLDKNNALIVLKNKLKNIFFTSSNKISYSFLNQLYSTFARKKYFTKFFLPMCDEQIKFINTNTDIKLSIWKCKLLFFILNLRNLFIGFLFGLKTLLLSLIHISLKRKKKITFKQIFFDLEMNEEDIENLKNANDFFIVKKFLKKFKVEKKIIINVRPKNKKIDFYKKKFDYNGYSFYFKNNPYPNIENISNFFKYLLWINLSFLICLKDLFFFKKWHNSFLFFEAVKSKLFHFSEKSQIPYIFIVPYNGSINRPLWTLDFKKNIKRSYMFFYSTNGEGYKTKFYNPNNENNWWGELDYDHFLVWDKYQSKTLKKYSKVKKPKVIVIGPILTSCSDTKMINLTKKFIVIFDIVPERFSYNTFISYSIIEPKHLIKFQNDILKLPVN
jgi:polysaccharide biosynthesis PFTS motif protein